MGRKIPPDGGGVGVWSGSAFRIGFPVPRMEYDGESYSGARNGPRTAFRVWDKYLYPLGLKSFLGPLKCEIRGFTFSAALLLIGSAATMAPRMAQDRAALLHLDMNKAPARIGQGCDC